MVAGVAATRLKYHVRPGRAASNELEVAAVVVRALADDRSDGRSRIDNWRVVIRRSFTRTCSTADICGYRRSNTVGGVCAALHYGRTYLVRAIAITWIICNSPANLVPCAMRELNLVC